MWVDSGQYMATVRVGGQWTVHGNSSCGWTVHGNSSCGWTVDSTWQQFVGGQWTVHGNSSCGLTVDSTWQQFVGGQWTVHGNNKTECHHPHELTPTGTH